MRAGVMYSMIGARRSLTLRLGAGRSILRAESLEHDAKPSRAVFGRRAGKVVASIAENVVELWSIGKGVPLQVRSLAELAPLVAAWSIALA
jgi:hypothetical protein